MKLFNANKLTNRRYGAHSVFENTYHLVFSTKKRAKYLNVFTKIKIRNFLREKEEELKFKIYLLNGYQDHLHILVSIPTTLSLAKLMAHIKGYSSFRMGRGRFWQKGYFARAIEKEELQKVFSYIRKQYHHHTNHQGILSELEIQYLAKEKEILKKAS